MQKSLCLLCAPPFYVEMERSRYSISRLTLAYTVLFLVQGNKRLGLSRCALTEFGPRERGPSRAGLQSAPFCSVHNRRNHPRLLIWAVYSSKLKFHQAHKNLP
ncbi:hypothetical protein K469DRAFT_51431 [Zopfia rhizophila CBS 207.26]|uniref:Uncharacterized protein n=1 Tax=Zopfia rhizophila CBS 207.26 TaxID=1314779 RepID=A0A6A6DED5_9PEZI|nr:hypothetical protein K469DRAFT_51431 [Zopfia rhizophila CBS 207.26]